MKPLRTVILAKAPQPGLAKTRLIPALGASGAAQLAQRMLQHTVQHMNNHVRGIDCRMF